ncbi:MAG: hypothetical protein O6757_10090, partial [Alphaproteobacteria bacterium]|nr:hypothetical protein [Alphaproteobacteria bacterium]
SIQALNYFVAQKYVDSLQAIASAPNHKIIFMPMEAAGVIGAIGGIADMVKEAFGGGGGDGGGTSGGRGPRPGGGQPSDEGAASGPRGSPEEAP